MKLFPQNRQEGQKALLFVVAFPLLFMTGLECLLGAQLFRHSDDYLVRLQGHGAGILDLALGLLLLSLVLVFAFVRPRLALLALLLLVLSAAFFLLTPVIHVCY